MGYAGDSDLVYLLHAGIQSGDFGLATPLFNLDGRNLVLLIDNREVTYTFVENNLTPQEVADAVNKAIPAVTITVEDDPGGSGFEIFVINSSSDVEVGYGTAVSAMFLTVGATNVLSAARRGPFRIPRDGVWIENDYPPLSATNRAQIELIEYNTAPDTPAVGLTALSFLHAKVVRPGTQIFESTAMINSNTLHYVDLDVSSYYPGPDHLVRSRADMSVAYATANGFSYSTEEEYSFSPAEPIKVVIPTVYRDDTPHPVIGYGMSVKANFAPPVTDVHYMMQTDYYRTVVCNPLACVSIPASIYISATYYGLQEVADAEVKVEEYIRSLGIGERFSIRAMISQLKKDGISIQAQPTVFVTTIAKDRTYTFTHVEELLALPVHNAFMNIEVNLTKTAL